METSVFQKAKAKAKKVKDTIRTKTGHGPGVDNTNQNDQEDEQMVEHSEVPDTGPKYDSPAVTSTVAGQKKPDDKLGKPATAAEDQYGSKYKDAQTRPSSQWPDENTGNRGVDTARPTGIGAAGVQVPKNKDGLFSSSGNLGAPGSESAGNFVHGEGGHLGDPKISSEKPAAMEEDPYTPNDQSKVADPTGTVGEEAGIGSILNSFNKLNVNDGKPESKPISERAPETYTESQDHFSQEPIPPTSTINPDDPGSNLKSFDGDKPEDAPLDNVTKLPSNQSSYAQKIPYADKAIAAKNIVASKLGYGSTEDPTASPKATQGGEEIGKPGTPTMYEKVFNAGSSVVTKVRGTGTKQDQGVEGQDQGVPVKKGYLAEKLRPSDDDKLLSEVISDSLHNRKQEVDGEEEGETQKPAVGKVTESEEVRERLGSDEGNRGVTETESKAAPNVSPTGKGMVESVKGTVASWFSKGGDQKQNSEASPGTIPEEERLSSSTGEEAVGRGQSGVGEGRLQG